MKRFGFALCLGGLLALASASTATASTTIGQLAPANPPAACVGGSNDILQSSLSSGNSYTVPSGGGTITSWSTNVAPGVGQTLTMKVFRPVSGTTYTVVAHDGPRALNPSTLNMFPGLSIPVQAGDVIGVNNQNASAVHNACLFTTGLPGDVFAADTSGSDLGDGQSASIAPAAAGFRLNLTAVLAVKPSNADTLGKVKVNKNNGTATIAVNVPGPGTLSLTGKNVKPQRPSRDATASKTVSAAGTVKLLVKAKGKAKSKLNKTGKAKVSVKVTYTPNGASSGDLVGDPNTQAKTVKLVKKR